MKKVLLFLFIIIINSPNLFSQINLSTSNITSNNAIVNWDNGGCPAGSYILRYRENGAAWNQNSPITITNTGGSQSYNLNNLTTNTTYNWRIKCGSGGSWVYGPNFSTSGPCLSSLSQTISSFSPNPLTGYMQNSTCSLTITNSGTCDLNIRPQFIISNNNSLINQGDIVIEWYNPAFSFWANIPYNVDNNGNAYGYWSPTSNSSHDSTGYEFQQGSAAQTIPVRVRFMNPNNSPPNGAPYGIYSAAWTTYEVDTLGNIIQSLSNTDTIEINLVDCSTFSIDNIVSNDATCFGGNDGDAVVVVSTGSGNYNYLWSNGQTSENIQSLTAGNYTVTVTDLSSGCIAYDSVLINEPLQILASYTSNNVTCNGGNDGAISITTTNGSGLYEYNWISHPSINGSSSATTLAADTYVINVIDSICSDVIPLSITISEPLPLSIDSTFSSENTSCDPTICNGLFGITVSGETPPYSFIWNQGGYTGALANDLCSGTYNITVTDAIGCNSLFESATINDNPFVPTLCLSLINDVTCNGGSNGSVLASIINGSCGGGTSNLTYCNSSPGDADYSNIELVSIIGDNGTSIANNTSNLCDLYEDYTSQSVTLSPGVTYNLIVNLGSCNAGQFQIDSGAVFIDWNQDGDFDDLDEKVSSFAGVQSPTSNSITINVPNNAVGGPTRMRIVSQAQGAGSLALTACNVGVYDLNNFIFTQPWFGATEDYTINIAESYLQGTYLWSNGSTDSLNNTLSAGIQTCTITDLNNCTVSESITISEPNALNFSISTTNVLCNGDNNGTAQITNISGGTSPYLTNWFGVDTTSLSAGTYSYLVLDNNGCVDSGSITITEPLAVSVSSSTTDVLCNGENSGTAEITNISGGTPPYSKNWFGVDTTSLFAGTYSYLVSDNNGCVDSGSVFIDEPTVLIATDSSTNVSCNGGNDGGATVYISGGTQTYILNAFGYSVPLLGATSYTTPVGVGAGNYPYFVSDGNSCSTSVNNILIGEPNPLNVITTSTNASCFGGNDGTAEITNISGGTLPYSTNWFGVDTTNLSNGNYSYQVLDFNLCSINGSVSINQPNPLNVITNSTNVSCFGGNDGTAEITNISGGTLPYSTNWFGVDTTNLSNGNYSYQVLDFNLCSINGSVSINQPNPLNVITNSTNVSCFGGNDGTAEITNISGGTLPYSTNWFGVDTTNLSNGNYSYQVLDFNLCSINGSVSINQPNPLNVTLISSNNITDCLNPNGSIDIDVSGGNGNYSYNWTSGQTTEDLVNLSAGNYSVTVNDNLNCSITFGPVNLTSPSPINWTINTTNYNGFEVSCNGESDGEIYVATTGGTGTITYNWPNLSSTNDTVSNLSAGSYTVIATDDANCTSTQLIELNQPSQIIIQDSIVQLNCDTASSLFSAELIISGGLPSYNVNWFGVNNSSLPIGTYPYLVSDLNGCSISNSITLVPSTPVTMVGYHNDVLCFGGSSGTAAFVVTDGVPPYSYLWSNGDTNSTATNLTAGMYYCTVTDANNCTYVDSILVSQPSTSIAVNINVLNDIQCFGDSVGAAEISSINGGVSPYYIQWENGITSNLASNLIGGYNIFSITDDNGCILTDSILINTNSEIQATYNISNILCNGDTTGEIQISSNNVTGGVPGTNGYFLQWINQTNGLSSTVINPLTSNTTILSGFTAGTHILTYSDSLGCLKNDSVTISQPDAISASIDSIQNVECWGDLTGFVQLTISGGITDYEFYNNTFNTLVPLTGGQLNYSFINHPAGTHTYSITDNNGCIYIDSIEILHLADSLHFISNVSDYNGVNISCKGYNDGWISIDTILGGFAPYTFNWSNGDTSTYIDSISVGWYTANLLDSFGCTFTKTFQIIEPAFALQTNMDSIHVSCFDYCDGMIFANNLSNFASVSGTAPYNYQWFDDNLNLVGTNDTLMNICDGNYSLTVTDANGCLNYETASISQPDKIIVFIDSIANVNINGLANGAITIQVSGGNSIYNYSWYGPNGFTSSNQNIFNLFAGSYYLIVNDQVGCYSDTVFVSISEPPAVSVNVDSVQTTFTTSCFGECDANIIINPVLSPIEPFSILWIGPNGFNSQDQNLYNLCGGIYILHIITSSDTTIFTFDIHEPDSLDVNIFANNITCYGETALATAYTYGGTLQYQFLWSNNSNNISTFLYEGTHYLSVTDANGCTSYDSITLNQPDSMWISSLITSDVSCNNLSNGSIDSINIEGGIAPFIFSIDQFASQQNNEIFTNLSVGNYTLQVIDSLGCETSIDLEIDNGTLFEVTTTNPTNYADTVDCNGMCNGFVQFNYIGQNGSPDPSWQQWSGGNINGDLCPGTYSVTFTDSIGCQATINNLVIFDAPMLNIDSTSSISPTCFNNANDGSAFIQGAGYYGNQQVSATQWPVQFSWPNIDPFPFVGNNPINLEPGTYTCYITHGPSGCMDSISVTVNNNSIPFLVEIVFDGINLTKGLTQPSGVTVTNYEWNTNENTQSILPQTNGQYWLIVTDDQGCISDTAFYNLTSLYNNYIDKNLFTIYPNPTNGYIFIESKKNISEVFIYNNLGELVLNDNNLNKYKSLDLSNFTKGVYYIKLNINNEIVKRKIILK